MLPRTPFQHFNRSDTQTIAHYFTVLIRAKKYD
jgi:hypothetical protein